MAVSTDQIGTFLQEQPPRAVPRRIRRAAYNTSMASGGGCFGLVFFLFSLPFVYGFMPWNFPIDLALDLGLGRTTIGTVRASEETKMSVNGNQVYAITIFFKTDDGVGHTAICYDRGRWDSQERVEVEYLPLWVRGARIAGTSTSKTGYFGLFVLIFPLVGGTMLFFSLRARRRLAWLLMNGSFETGTIIAVTATNLEVNDQRRYKVKVRYETQGMEQVSEYPAYGDQVDLAQERKESKDPVGLLVNPEKPDQILLVDALIEP